MKEPEMQKNQPNTYILITEGPENKVAALRM